jgi:hypothetical protein
MVMFCPPYFFAFILTEKYCIQILFILVDEVVSHGFEIWLPMWGPQRGGLGVMGGDTPGPEDRKS